MSIFIMIKLNITKKELLTALNSFFRQILNDKGFPLQYPAGCKEDIDGTRTKVDSMLEEILQLLPKALAHDNEIHNGIENICMNYLVKLDAESQSYVNDYREMLEKHVIPMHWQ